MVLPQWRQKDTLRVMGVSRNGRRMVTVSPCGVRGTFALASELAETKSPRAPDRSKRRLPSVRLPSSLLQISLSSLRVLAVESLAVSVSRNPLQRVSPFLSDRTIGRSLWSLYKAQCEP